MSENLPGQGEGAIEIAVKPDDDTGWWLGMSLPMALLLVIMGLYIGGVSIALVSLLIAALIGVTAWKLGSRMQRTRVILTDDEVVLLPRRPGSLSARPFSFRWDEVSEIARPYWFIARVKPGMLIKLSRPRRFWSFKSAGQRKVIVQRAFCEDPRFMEALLANVPEEKIRPGALDMSNADNPRFTWRFALPLFACAVLAGWCSASLARTGNFFTFIVPLMAAMVGAILFLSARHEKMPGSLGLIYGLLMCLGFSGKLPLIRMLLFPYGYAFAAAWFGVCAGALAGAGMALLLWRKVNAWALMLGFFALCAAGGIWCRANARTLAAVRVGPGNSPGSLTWTPQGDAFLIMEGEFEAKSSGSLAACWYSASNLKLKRRSLLPKYSRLIALGEKAALFASNTESDSSLLWYVPRNGDARSIDEADYFPNSAQAVSPDGRYVLVVTWRERIKARSWQLCDLEDGTLASVHSSFPVDEAKIISLRNDRTVIWGEGAFARGKKNRSFDMRRSLPEPGELSHSGTPFVVKAWGIESNSPPEVLYSAKTEWLAAQRAGTPEQLNVLRVSESKPEHFEVARLDFSRSPVVETVTPIDKYQDYRPGDSSYDDRYTVIDRECKPFTRSFIRDNRTGQEVLLPFPGISFGFLESPGWSPADHKLLMTVPLAIPDTELWSWYHSPVQYSGTEMAVYMVDMDNQ